MSSFSPPPPLDLPHRPIIVRSSISRGMIGALLGIVATVIVFVFGWVIGLGTGVAAVSSGSRIERTITRTGHHGTVMVIPVEGGIDEPMANFITECVREALTHDTPDAIVLRVDSGGGGVSPSDRIWRCMEEFRAQGIPVIASFGGTAASGGYYVACASEQIFAEPTCITGSIGVIAQMFTLQGLTDKVGVTPMTIVASGSPRKDTANDMFRTWDDKDRQVIQGILDSAYGTFVQRVFDGRQIHFTSLEDVRQVADGSVYTAEQALEAGLVDHVGYLEDAIAAAEAAISVAPGAATVVQLHRPAGLFDSAFAGSSRLPSISSPIDLRDMAAELAQPRLMYQLHW